MGYWEEKRKYEKEALEKQKPHSCGNCGGIKKLIAKCSDCDIYLCKDCADFCDECKRYFCPEHIDNHDCIEDENEEEWWDLTRFFRRKNK